MQAREKLLINYSAPAACCGVKFAPMEFDLTSQKAPRNESGAECEASNYAEIHEENDRRRAIVVALWPTMKEEDKSVSVTYCRSAEEPRLPGLRRRSSCGREGWSRRVHIFI